MRIQGGGDNGHIFKRGGEIWRKKIEKKLNKSF